MRLLIFLCLVLLSACGATVGDACTTSKDCGNNTCITRDFAPGGYCSLSCTLGADFACPAGTVCVREALGRNTAGCMKSCVTGNDCRDGYVCKQEKDSPSTICVGPSGI